jgi:hypothetical protein
LSTATNRRNDFVESAPTAVAHDIQNVLQLRSESLSIKRYVKRCAVKIELNLPHRVTILDSKDSGSAATKKEKGRSLSRRPLV